MTLHGEVMSILRRYRVQRHYRASSAYVVTFAVFNGRGQVSEPLPFADAKEEAHRLTANDLVEFFARHKD